MKRILLSVFAVALTAAWALPTTATASEVTLGGEYRLRGEQTNNYDFNGLANDHTDFWGQRVRLTANAKATDDTTVKITLQDSRNWGSTGQAQNGPGLSDTCGSAVAAGAATAACNGTDLHESYVNIDKLVGAPISLRAGRQELAYGDQRLIGSFGWSNNGRSFDALKFTATTEPANVDFFISKINDRSTTARDQDFYGLYATIKAIPSNTVDFYILSLREQTGTNALVSNNTAAATLVGGGALKTQTLNTYGLRLNGGLTGIDYTVEGAIQTGQIENTTTKYKMNGRAFAIKGGYTLTAPVKIRVGAEYDYASGDKDAADNKLTTFFNLFPTNHDKMGYMDQQAWRNVKAFNLNLKADVTDTTSIYAGFWNFKLADKHDGWYGAGSWNSTAAAGIRTASATNTATAIGNEIDLVLSHKYNPAVTVDLGYSRFMAGKFIKQQVENAGGKKEDASWTYLQLTAKF